MVHHEALVKDGIFNTRADASIVLCQCTHRLLPFPDQRLQAFAVCVAVWHRRESRSGRSCCSSSEFNWDHFQALLLTRIRFETILHNSICYMLAIPIEFQPCHNPESCNSFASSARGFNHSEVSIVQSSSSWQTAVRPRFLSRGPVGPD